MKWIKTLLVVWVAMALTSTPSMSGEKIVRDADGNKWLVDTETEATPGAGSGTGALIGAVDDTLRSFETHKFDLQIGIMAVGQAGDDSSGTETALTSATLYWRPNSWLRLGPQFSWNTVETSTFTFGLPVSFKLFPNPWATYNFWLDLNVLPLFTIRTDDSLEMPRKSAFSWIPAVMFKAEVPMGAWSVEFGLGTAFPFSIEGITDQEANAAVEQVAFGAEAAVNIRLGR